jgi:hypothetical protein
VSSETERGINERTRVVSGILAFVASTTDYVSFRKTEERCGVLNSSRAGSMVRVFDSRTRATARRGQSG